MPVTGTATDHSPTHYSNYSPTRPLAHSPTPPTHQEIHTDTETKLPILGDAACEVEPCAPRPWAGPREGTVPLVSLIAALAPLAEATAVIPIGDDGYRQELPLAAVRDATDALVVTAPDGTWRVIFPGQRPRQRAKGLVGIEVR